MQGGCVSSELGSMMMTVSQLLGVLVQLVLWVGVAAVSARVQVPRGRMFLVAGAVLGALLALAVPAVNVVLAQVILSQISVDTYLIGMAVFNSLVSLLYVAPWGLMLAGLWIVGTATRQGSGEG